VVESRARKTNDKVKWESEIVGERAHPLFEMWADEEYAGGSSVRWSTSGTW
jgi:hypothetical protein